MASNNNRCGCCFARKLNNGTTFLRHGRARKRVRFFILFAYEQRWSFYQSNRFDILIVLWKNFTKKKFEYLIERVIHGCLSVIKKKKTVTWKSLSLVGAKNCNIRSRVYRRDYYVYCSFISFTSALRSLFRKGYRMLVLVKTNIVVTRLALKLRVVLSFVYSHNYSYKKIIGQSSVRYFSKFFVSFFGIVQQIRTNGGLG